MQHVSSAAFTLHPSLVRAFTGFSPLTVTTCWPLISLNQQLLTLLGGFSGLFSTLVPQLLEQGIASGLSLTMVVLWKNADTQLYSVTAQFSHPLEQD